MLKKLGAISIVLCLCSCSLLPGMQNLKVSEIQRTPLPPPIKPHPVLIRITPALLLNKRARRYTYKVAPSDVLNITVWEHPEFNILPVPNGSSAVMTGSQGAAGQAGYLVNSKGRIYFPLVGYVSVKDHTVDSIRADISDRLKKYIPDPQVNVRVVDYRGRKIYVIGEVKKPGVVPLNDQVLTVADALALTGGIDQNVGDPKHIYIIRGTVACPVIYWLNAKTPDKLLLAEHFNLYPKDILYVSSAPATRWNRMLNQLLPTLQAVWYTKVITTTNY